MMRCGLLGRKLGHSYSPQIHAYLGSYSYELFEKEPQDVEHFLKCGDFSCLNVTIPYKKDVIPYCSELSDCAKKLGAVNTIIRRADGTLIGHNTDFFGFSYMIKKAGVNPKGKQALVFGTGGASVTAIAVLEEMGACVNVISHKENTVETLQKFPDTELIVNATPVGMFPHVGNSPADLSLFPNLKAVLDMIYNPSRTRLLLDAQERGIVAENGLWMLAAQAKESAEWFTGHQIPNQIIDDIHRNLTMQMENIILIGMPGSGKSTIGKLLAEQLGRPFADSDTEIERNACRPIPDIFLHDGENAFRKLETQTLAELGKASGMVIATGGGCVTRTENYRHLHQNGVLVWLRRDLPSLPVDGRPISQSVNIEDLYQRRKHLYEQFSDVTVENNGTTQETVANIVDFLKRRML